MENSSQKEIEKRNEGELQLSNQVKKEDRLEIKNKTPISLAELQVQKKILIRRFKQQEESFFNPAYSIIQNDLLHAQRKLIAAYTQTFLKLYEIVDQKIRYLSTHKIVFPVKVKPDDLTWFRPAPKNEIIFIAKQNHQKEGKPAEEGGNQRMVL